MYIGSIKQKANPVLVVFVFICILITTELLYVLQKSEAVVNNLSLKSTSSSAYYSELNNSPLY